MPKQVPKVPPEFKEWLRSELDKRKWSIREAARNFGVSHPTISDIFNLDRQPSYETCAAIANTLSIPPIEIWKLAGLANDKETEETYVSDEFIEWLKYEVNEKYESLQDLADDVNIPWGWGGSSIVFSIFEDKMQPSFEHALVIARKLDIPPVIFFFKAGLIQEDDLDLESDSNVKPDWAYIIEKLTEEELLKVIEFAKFMIDQRKNS